MKFKNEIEAEEFKKMMIEKMKPEIFEDDEYKIEIHKVVINKALITGEPIIDDFMVKIFIHFTAEVSLKQILKISMKAFDKVHELYVSKYSLPSIIDVVLKDDENEDLYRSFYYEHSSNRDEFEYFLERRLNGATNDELLNEFYKRERERMKGKKKIMIMSKLKFDLRISDEYNNFVSKELIEIPEFSTYNKDIEKSLIEIRDYLPEPISIKLKRKISKELISEMLNKISIKLKEW